MRGTRLVVKVFVCVVVVVGGGGVEQLIFYSPRYNIVCVL